MHPNSEIGALSPRALTLSNPSVECTVPFPPSSLPASRCSSHPVLHFLPTAYQDIVEDRPSSLSCPIWKPRTTSKASPSISLRNGKHSRSQATTDDASSLTQRSCRTQRTFDSFPPTATHVFQLIGESTYASSRSQTCLSAGDLSFSRRWLSRVRGCRQRILAKVRFQPSPQILSVC